MKEIEEKIGKYFRTGEKGMMRIGQLLCHQYKINYYVAVSLITARWTLQDQRRGYSWKKKYIVNRMSLSKMKQNNNHLQLYHPYHETDFKNLKIYKITLNHNSHGTKNDIPDRREGVESNIRHLG